VENQSVENSLLVENRIPSQVLEPEFSFGGSVPAQNTDDAPLDLDVGGRGNDRRHL
jgi:hypothetical protein